MSKIGVSPREFLDKEVDMDLDDVEVNLGEIETEISKISVNNDKLQRSHNDLVEYKILLDKSEIESQKVGERHLQDSFAAGGVLFKQETSVDPTIQVC
ncbi:hypothetical protein DY000_02053466 [Brassica cretica]|uniref:t-SNARE coiled-coil homology domain-containing protein n=1 Tax=Brassica cretica TaxID=69181 RepID=A0ABQ7AKT8_BRACR|nr:hypothetical protein DY000_02053466 [Brassica cretica]